MSNSIRSTTITRKDFDALRARASWACSDTNAQCTILMVATLQDREDSLYDVYVFVNLTEQSADCYDHRFGFTYMQAVEQVASQIKEESSW